MQPALVWLLLGTAAARRFLFPLLFLFFAVPAGEVLVPPLQDFTAWFTVEALRLSGIPVLLEGRYLMVPSATWEVAEACSGVRYLISMIALGSVFAWVAYRSWQRRALFLLAAMLVPLLANGLRAYGIVVLGYLTDNRIAVGVDHLIYGWVFFGAVGAFLFTVGWHWHEPSMRGATTPGPARTVIHPTATARTPLAPGLAAALAALTLVGWAPLTAAHLQSAVAVAEISAPSVLPPWRPADHVEGWQPTFVGATAEVLQAYEHEEQWVHLFVAYYASEQQGAELVSSMNHLFDRKHWRPLGNRTVTISVDGQLCRAEQTVIRSRHGTRVLWSWYSVAGTCTSNSVAAKLLQAKAWLLRDPRAGALVAVSTVSADQEAAARTLQDFLNHVSLATVFRHS